MDDIVINTVEFKVEKNLLTLYTHMYAYIFTYIYIYFTLYISQDSNVKSAICECRKLF